MPTTGSRRGLDERALALFGEAIGFAPDERLEHIRARCRGDRDLLEEVRSLLEWDARGDGVLDRPLGLRVPAPGAEVGAPPPAAVGPYEVVSILGAGGMGVVYLARQRAPVDRLVALKVIRRGVDTEEARRRFSFEQQALAIMNHAAVATVYGAGVTDDGCPYFAMEYVAGLPMTDYCDRQRLTVEKRVEVMLKVSAAVHHAHQKGVIHRDIKASNVIVARTDDGHQPKVIDFGVALALDPMLLREGHPVTGAQGMLGTLETMSPEQLDHGPHHVDTRADIYSLGVLLFELVAGVPPHTFTGEKGLASVRETLCATPAPSLASVMAGQGQQQLEAVACDRGTTRRGLLSLARSELGWILAKTLEKDRELRYASVAELAADLGRWLRQEPVSAHPPRWSYRLRKLVRRRRALSAAVLIAVAGLGIGLGVATRSYLEASRARRRAASLLADYRSLADGAQLGELRLEAEQLWPAWPQQIAAMEGWVRRAEELVRRREQHLARLGEGVVPAVGDRDLGFVRRRLDEIDTVLDSFGRFEESAAGSDDLSASGAATFLALKRRQVENERDELVRRLVRSRSEDGRRGEDPWLGGQLMRLVHEMDAFSARYLAPASSDAMSTRIDRARRTGVDTALTHGAAWRHAIRQIAGSPRYGGLEIEPQHGLVPLGPDPDSGLWEFFVPDLGQRPAAWADGGFDMTADDGMILVLLPGGTFNMGAQRLAPGGRGYDPRAWQHEAPVHQVTLDPFFVSKYEMTWGQWVRLAGTEPSTVTPVEAEDTARGRGRGSLPVDQVYWDRSREALRRAGLLLPTEAQWEYAARAGTTGPWHFGRKLFHFNRFANLRDRSKLLSDRAQHEAQLTARYQTSLTDGYPGLAPVGSFAPNPFGLYDVFGNAAEWCADWFQVYYCPVEPGTGLRIPADEGPKLRVLRGGHFDSLPEAARVSSRIHVNPHVAGPGIGLRPVRPLIRTETGLAPYRWGE